MMTLSMWLESEEGRGKALALHCGVSDAAVSQWKTNGVPLHQLRRVAAFTGGQVSVADLIDQVLTRAEGRAPEKRPEEAQRAA
jgi:DNA-binding transcriptional regulator YdaS (Cro superfamily)